MRVLLATLLASLYGAAALAASGAGAQTFTGVVTDSECVRADHSRMRMGPTDAECVAACVDAHGATYMLYDGKSAYDLSDQTAASHFAAQRVSVVGSLDAKKRTIAVTSIRAAK